MTPYNINVVKPEDEKPYCNALQLQAAGVAFGHHSNSLPYPDETVASFASTYPHISTSGFVNNPYSNRPRLAHLETSSSQIPLDMQGESSSGSGDVQRRYAMSNTGFAHGQSGYAHGRAGFAYGHAGITHGQSSSLQVSPIVHGWTMVNDFVGANIQSNFIGGSPLSQGHSPLTPNTPLSTVEPSPTVSSFPSPGSQGSEVSRLEPSPVHQQTSLGTATELPSAFNQLQLINFYYHHHGSETQLSAQPTSYAHTPSAPAYPHFSDTMHSPSHLGVLSRRHSHSALGHPQPHNSPPSGFSPYPTPTSLPSRVPVARNRAFIEVPLVPRPEYKFQDWCLPGPVVPQTQYQPHSASDRKRYVEEFTLQQPIYFGRTDGPGIGITLPECVTQRFKQLVGYDDDLFEGLGPSISIRLNWICYSSWTRQIPTRNFKVPPGPVSRKNLAKNIAKTVQKFIDDHIHSQIQLGTDARWQVGPGKIEFGDLVLLSIHHVSKGSWQANLCLTQPLEQILSRSLAQY